MRKMLCFVLLVLLFAGNTAFAQKGVITAGFQYRSLLPTGLFTNATITGRDEIYSIELTPQLGHSFGMLIRRGFTKMISFETGINQIRRNFGIAHFDDSLNVEDRSSYGMLSYEIPIQGLVFIRLGEQFYMNTSLGVSVSRIPTHVQSKGDNPEFFQQTFRKRHFQSSVIANIGFEYRTEKSGYFYLGSSVNWPFNPVAEIVSTFDPDYDKFTVRAPVRGAFFTIDLRYFFSEPVNNNKKKKRQS